MRVILAIAAFIFLASVVGSILVLRAPHGQMVQIVQNSNVLYTFDLSNRMIRRFRWNMKAEQTSFRFKTVKFECWRQIVLITPAFKWDG